jgi:hypothetical protein
VSETVRLDVGFGMVFSLDTRMGATPSVRLQAALEILPDMRSQ